MEHRTHIPGKGNGGGGGERRVEERGYKGSKKKKKRMGKEGRAKNFNIEEKP